MVSDSAMWLQAAVTIAIRYLTVRRSIKNLYVYNLSDISYNLSFSFFLFF